MEEYFDIRTLLRGDVQQILQKDDSQLNEDELYRKEFFGGIAEETDGKIPKDIAEMLIKENNDPDYAILIHRTSRAKKEDIFENGLIIAGGNDISYTMSGYDEKKQDNFHLMLGIRDAAGYKSDWGQGSRCLVMKVPISALEYQEGVSKPILFETDMTAEQSGGMAVVKGKYQTVLLPEYVLGSIEFDENKKMQEFVTNPNYTDVHDYKNDGLVCTEQLISSYLKHKEIERNDSSKQIANEEIIKENTDYMQHPENYTKRTETELKEYSKKNMLLSKFNEMARRIKQFFTKEREDRDDISK